MWGQFIIEVLEAGMKQMLTHWLLACVLVGHSGPVCIADDFKVETLATGLGIPWGMTFIANDKLLFTERSGNLKVLNLESGLVNNVVGAPEVVARGQGGLMDVRTSPQFDSDGWIYFTYSMPVGGETATALGRARLSNYRLIDWQTLFVSSLVSGRAAHFGSRLCFDGSGHLFLSHGDRGQRNTAQQLSNHGGTVIRLGLDGTVPGDNPFVGTSDVQPEIWSYGHRNPQGIACDIDRGRLWLMDHGPRGGDELNLVEAGKNYGWPVISYGKEYTLPVMVGEGTHKAGMEQPSKVYVPSIAPGSLLLYTGGAFPEWQGSLFSGALAMRHLNRIIVDGNGTVGGEERLLENMGERIRQVIQGPEGELVLSTDSGKILRLVPDA
jgi:aldose sugar dehydrogenase